MWKVLKTTQLAVIHGQVFKVGACLQHFFYVRSYRFNLDAIEAKFIDLFNIFDSVYTFSDLIFSPSKHYFVEFRRILI